LLAPRQVEYRDSSPWPTKADGKGQSLQRASSSVIGNTAANWTANTPTPGAINLGIVTNALISTTSPLLGGVVNVAYTNTFVATGGSTPYSWSITSGSVPGLSLSTNGVLSGTPTTAGTNTITVQLTDSVGFTTNKQFILVVVTTAPGIITSALTNATIGTAYSQALAASGGTSPYTWSLVSGSLPGGLTLNSAGVISGTPTTNGTFSFTIQLADTYGLTASSAFTLTVVAAALDITTTTPMAGGQQGTYYSQALTGAGGVTPYTWSLASGSLPTGLSLDSLGDITGTPTALGYFSFTVQLTDSPGTNVTKPLVIRIVSPTLAVDTSTLPDGKVGEAYSQTLAATGGATPYSWSLTWGGLPDGLNLSSAGVVSGTPTNYGTFSFIVQVTDNVSAMASKMFTVEIAHSAPILSAIGWTGGTFQLQVLGDAGADYVIQTSTNLTDWTSVFTNNAAATPFQWSDTGASNMATFYHAILNP
jgi:hypothetical protein